MSLNVTQVHRNLQQRVTFLYLEFEDLFVVIANWPRAREAHWTNLLIARAIENQAYAVGVNRCGADPKNAYSGRSAILDPRGKEMVSAGSEESLVEAEMDHAALVEYRHEFPALDDRRDDLCV